MRCLAPAPPEHVTAADRSPSGASTLAGGCFSSPSPPHTTPDLNTLPSHIRTTAASLLSPRRRRQYAMSVIVSRALPDVRDGLKPVHRWALWERVAALG